MSTELIILIVLVVLIVVVSGIFKLKKEMTDEEKMVFTKRGREKIKENFAEMGDELIKFQSGELCPFCKARTEPNQDVCPSCQATIMDNCVNCGNKKPIKALVCAECGQTYDRM